MLDRKSIQCEKPLHLQNDSNLFSLQNWTFHVFKRGFRGQKLIYHPGVYVYNFHIRRYVIYLNLYIFLCVRWNIFRKQVPWKWVITFNTYLDKNGKKSCGYVGSILIYKLESRRRREKVILFTGRVRGGRKIRNLLFIIHPLFHFPPAICLLQYYFRIRLWYFSAPF